MSATSPRITLADAVPRPVPMETTVYAPRVVDYRTFRRLTGNGLLAYLVSGGTLSRADAAQVMHEWLMARRRCHRHRGLFYCYCSPGRAAHPC